MGKDPAFLFYSGDFLCGTMTMTHRQVGVFIRLLCLQHQQGHLSEKSMRSVCRNSDPVVLNKFLRDGEGLYYNERLEREMGKRRAYSESRRKNRTGLSSTYVLHMENENRNRNENKDKGVDKNAADGKQAARRGRKSDLELLEHMMGQGSGGGKKEGRST